MTNNTPAFFSVPDDHIIATTRIFQAPAATVFKAWTDPDHLKNWWGPNGFTNTFHVFEPVPGGKWSFTMHGPDGKNYQNDSVFIIIEPEKLIVFDHISQPQFQIETVFIPVSNDRTSLTFKMKFRTKEECDTIKAFAAGKNEENMDRLEKELVKMK